MITDPVPSDVYLDTSLVIAAIVRGSDHSLQSIEFCDRLIARGSRVYFSQILRLELSEAIRRLATSPDRLPPDIRHAHQLEAWDTNLLVRRGWMDFGVRQFEALVDRFAEAFELPFRLRTWQRSIDVIVDHRLRSLDALHVATAREYRLRHLATTDGDFKRVADLRVWLIQDVSSDR